MAEIQRELQAELLTKFTRYSVATNGDQLMNFRGFKYVITGSTGLESLEDATLERVFLAATGVDTIKTAKTNFEGFLRAMTGLAVELFPADSSSPDTAVLRLCANHLLPHHLGDKRVQAALATSSGSTASSSSGGSSSGSINSNNDSAGPAEAAAASAAPPSEAAEAPAAAPSPAPAHLRDLAADGIMASVSSSSASVVLSPAHTEHVHFVATAPAPAPAAAAPTATVTSFGVKKEVSPELALLYTFLQSLRLDAFTNAIVSRGVERVEDLDELSDEDFDACGMKALHKRRLREAAQRWKQEVNAGGEGTSATSSTSSAGAASSSAAASAATAQVLREPAATSPYTARVQPSTGSSGSAAAAAEANSDSSAAPYSPAPTADAHDVLSPATPSNMPSSASAMASPEPGHAESAVPIGLGLKYDWEEYATADGFLYYHNTATGATQWMRPFSSSVRTVAMREDEKRALAALVEQRVQAALRATGSGASAARSAALTTQSNAAPSESTQAAVRRGLWSTVLAPTSSSSASAASAAASPASPAAASAAASPSRRVVSSAAQPRIVMTSGTGAGRGSGSGISEAQPVSSALPLAAATEPYGNSSYASASASRASDVAAGRDLAGEGVGVAGVTGEEEGYYYSTSHGGHVGHGYEAEGSATSPGTHSVMSGQHGMMSGARSVAASSVRSAAYSYAPGVGATAASVAGSRRHKYARGGGGDGASVMSRVSLAAEYADVFADMPAMDEATQEIIAASHMVANPRRMGYADPRPDIRPTSVFHLNEDQVAERLHFSSREIGDKATAAFAGQLRSGLYSSSSDPQAPRTGRDIQTAWGSSGVAPSDAAPGYAYRHAATISQKAGAGTVYDRLTDHRGYTGTHRHRFDTEGRGVGMAGRDNAGTDVARVMSTMPASAAEGAPYLDVPSHLPASGRAASPSKVPSRRR